METALAQDAELLWFDSCVVFNNFPVCEVEGQSFNRKALGLTECARVPLRPLGMEGRGGRR